MSYTEVVQAIKRNPNRVVLMVLQPYEKNALVRRGVQLTSSTCPAQIVHGRSRPDDTTRVSLIFQKFITYQIIGIIIVGKSN